MSISIPCHAVLHHKFGPPAKGNDKGKVTGLVGHKTMSHFMVPSPVADDFDALNAKLLVGCLKRQRAVAAWSVRYHRPVHGQRQGDADALAGNVLCRHSQAKQPGILTSASPLTHSRLFGTEATRPSGGANQRHRRLGRHLSSRL